MEDVKTVDNLFKVDPLIAKQREDVAKMRASLLCCSGDPFTAAQAMKNITVLRIYHQMSRIIRYTEMMDKVEEKLYQTIDQQLSVVDTSNPTSWMMLLTIQERLQKNMVDSQKLIQPYIDQMKDLEDFVVVSEQAVESSPENNLLTKESREKIRSSAQQVLSIIEPMKEAANDR